jgi:hypothetical protein
VYEIILQGRQFFKLNTIIRDETADGLYIMYANIRNILKLLDLCEENLSEMKK